MFYDAGCLFCRKFARGWAGFLGRCGFRLVPLQTPGAAHRLGVPIEDLFARVHLLTSDGRLLKGADACVEIARARWWMSPLVWLAALPGGLPLLRWAYARFANNRYAFGACSLERNTPQPRPAASSGRVLDGLPLVVLTTICFSFRPWIAPWIFMWALALALFWGCKWLTWREAVRAGVPLHRRDALSYLLGWVGMEPREFVRRVARAATIPLTRFLGPIARVLLGTTLIWAGVRAVLPLSSVAAGWTGMVGVILLLHFGLFDLLALAWQRTGVAVRPLMNAPARAKSVGDFWGARWNRGFHALAHRFVYRAWVGVCGRPAAVMAVFVISGLIHDLVITIPAGGGYGLPTAYFLLQGLALLLERSALGRRLKLGIGLRGRLFALVVVVPPAFWLFPPVFVRHVILPMLHAIGAT